MNNTNELLNQLYVVDDAYEEIHQYCIDKKCQPFNEESPKIPQPEIAKWRMQEFSDDDCRKLADGTLELKPYKREKFPIPLPTLSRITNIIIAVLGVITILFFSFFLAQQIKLSQGDKQVALAKAEYAAIDNLFEDNNYVAWRNLWSYSPTTDQLKSNWNPVEESWNKQGYTVTFDTLEIIFEQAKKSNGNISLSDFEYYLRRHLRNNQTTFNKDMVDIGLNTSIAVSNEWLHSTEYVRNTLLTFFILFLAGTIGFTIITTVKEKSIFSYVRQKKKYEQDKTEYEQEQSRLEEEYNSQILTEHARYKIIYEEYLKQLESYKSLCINHNNEMEKTIQTYYDIILGMVEKISHLDLLPLKYANAISNIKSTDYISQKYYSDSIIKTTKYLNLVVFYSSEIKELKTEIDAIIEILEDGRADTYKEAINCYHADCEERYNRELERRHREIMAKQAAQAAENQMKAIKEASITVINTKIAEFEVQIEQLNRDYLAGKINHVELNLRTSDIKKKITELERQKY